jgi:hypothetical protein
MLIISHRGNVSGINEGLENNPEHIKTLLQDKIEVEIDVWIVDKLLLLGHDKPQYIINEEFLQQNGLWCHAKNLDALHYMIKHNIKNYFWHQEDDFTLTSSGYIWTFPNKEVTNESIIVDFSQNWKDKNYSCYGVCVDYL